MAQLGERCIRSRAKKVLNGNFARTQKTIEDLIDSMRFHELVGMAAPQIGIPLRIFITEIRATKLRKGQGAHNADVLRVFMNPVIISKSKQLKTGYEGCGSVANVGLFGKVKRSNSVTIRAQDRAGKPFVLKANHLLARVIQHECDHLNGIVFTDVADPLSFMSRSEYLRKFRK